MIDVAATRVFLVEDQPPMRERLHEYLGEIEGVMVVGDAATPKDAIAGILETLPDLVLLDYHLDGGTGIEVLRGVRPVAPGVVFVVLTQHDAPQLRRACLAAGASHVLDKSTEFGKIRQLVVEAGAGRH
jgi:DNA-binding NarL/FixJ family response regulator